MINETRANFLQSKEFAELQKLLPSDIWQKFLELDDDRQKEVAKYFIEGQWNALGVDATKALTLLINSYHKAKDSNGEAILREYQTHQKPKAKSVTAGQ